MWVTKGWSKNGQRVVNTLNVNSWEAERGNNGGQIEIGGQIETWWPIRENKVAINITVVK